MNNELIQTTINADTRTLWHLISIYADETKKLREAYEKFRNGYELRFHINYYLKNLYNDRSRAGEIELNGQIYTLEEWWREIEDQRANNARKALIEHFTKENAPWKAR